MKPTLTPLVCQVCSKKVMSIKTFENELRKGHWFDSNKLNIFLLELENNQVYKKSKERVEFT